MFVSLNIQNFKVIKKVVWLQVWKCLRLLLRHLVIIISQKRPTLSTRSKALVTNAVIL